MSLLIETIRLCDGVFNNLTYHQIRMNRAFKEVFQKEVSWKLEEMLQTQKFPTKGLYRCRVSYDSENKEVEFVSYEVKPIKTLKQVYDDTISYAHKFKDRKNIEQLFAKRGDCDDILIIRKGWVTDTFYANIIFKKDNLWFTPSSCLLQGTMRQYLIDQNEVRVMDIREEDILQFETFKLVNAMLLDGGPEIGISKLLF